MENMQFFKEVHKDVIPNTLAGKKCIRGNTITILHSPKGYSLGTKDAFGYHYCRISSSFVDSKEDTHKLQADRKCINNDICNNGKGCFIS